MAESLDFRRGYAAGYQARVQEEVRSYFAAITAGHEVYDRVLRALVEVPSHAERERARLLVVREGHDAGLHEGGRRGCPWCEEAKPRPRPACEFHRERGEGYVIGCPACEAVLAKQVTL